MSDAVEYCSYCGKEFYEDEAFCAKCGRDVSYAVMEPPAGKAGELYPKIRDLRERPANRGWNALVFGALLVAVAGVLWYGLWVIPRRAPDVVRPAIVDQPMVQIDPADRVQPEAPTEPTGPVLSPDDAIERVRWVPEVALWLRTMVTTEANIRLTVADEDDLTYTVQLAEAVQAGDNPRTITIGLWSVEKATGDVTKQAEGVDESSEQSEDREQVEELVRGATGLRADYIDTTLAGDWAFVDISEQDDQGRWVRATSVMLRRVSEGWRVVAEGDPVAWTMQRGQMSPEAQQAFDIWRLGHL